MRVAGRASVPRASNRPAITRPASDGRRGRAGAFVVLAGAAVAAWWPVLGPGLLWTAPMVVVAVLLVVGRLRVRTAIGLALVWLPLAPLLAGQPAAVLAPRALGATLRALAGGVDALTVPARGAIGSDHWPLAAALAGAGLLWTLAALVSTRSGGLARALSFLLLAAPVLAGLVLEQAGDDVAWPGAAMLAAGLLWLTTGGLRFALPATLAIGLVAAAGAQAIGPQERWIPFVDVAARDPAFTSLDTTQTYGPLTHRRTGATMLEITSDGPALWRMQVLERFDGRTWGTSLRMRDDLPEPAAVTHTTTVRVRGLRDQLVVAPGRITKVVGGGTVMASSDDAQQFRSSPDSGTTYRVESSLVQATEAELAGVSIPTGAQYAAYTRVWPERYNPSGGQYGRRARPTPASGAASLPPGLASTPAGRVVQLARKLSTGTDSELEVVRRVQSYLLDGGRFRYTTDVPRPGAQPLYDFLLRTHAGYCQQFAGSAALLLRLAGIPARVVTGFATGTTSDGKTFDVRDKDAHAWIEVYFPGYGWVPFNPTPADADAQVDGSLDVFSPTTASGLGAGTPSAGLLLAPVAVALLGGGVLVLRRRRRPAGPAATTLAGALAHLAPGPIGPSTTLSTLRPQLLRIGPAVGALVDRAERERFADDGTLPDRHPRLRVWRAVVRDVGVGRAVRLAARGGARRRRP